jgi:Zn-dependent protease with chaperone function
LALSREMEFHADEVAANVTGYLPLKESLLRMDLASHSYNSVISFYENKVNENIKSEMSMMTGIRYIRSTHKMLFNVETSVIFNVK